MLILLALLIGIVAGLRAFTAPAAVAWAAYLGWLHLDGSWAAFLGSLWAVVAFSALALVEYVGDQLPSTPSRTVPMQLGARLVSGAFSGVAVGAAGGTTASWAGGVAAGIVGALIGTYGGAWARGRLAAAFGRDRPAGLLEDAVAILAGLLILGVA